MATINSSNTISGAFSAPLRFAGVPVSGTSGTYKNQPAGVQLVNTLTGIHYINTSTTAGSPTWSPVTTG